MGGKAMNGRRVSYCMGLEVAQDVITKLASKDECWVVCGSLRREKPEAGDVDLVVKPVPGQEEYFESRLRSLFGTQVNGKAKHSGLVGGVQVDVLVTNEQGWGAALLFLTGSWQHNVVMRAKAKKLGLLLNEKGLWKAAVNAKGKTVAGEYVAGRTEEEVFAALGMEPVLPVNREVEGMEK